MKKQLEHIKRLSEELDKENPLEFSLGIREGGAGKSQDLMQKRRKIFLMKEFSVIKGGEP